MASSLAWTAQSAADVAEQPHPRGSTIHTLVADSILRHPDRIAVREGDHLLSYRDLDRLAQDFAAELTSAGARPGDIVPLLMPRSARLAIAALAVLRCGAAYAALDPAWPAGHLARLLSLIDSPVLITDRAVPGPAARLAPTDWDGMAATLRSPRPHTPVDVDGTAAATVFFTSGTTGLPKGVVSPHLGTVRLFHDCPFATFDEHTVMPLAAAVPWDVLSCELWGPLMNGGCVTVVTDRYLLPSGLREFVTRYGVQTVFFTPTLFNMIVDEDVGAFAGLEQVLIAGERASPGHCARLLAHHPDVVLINAYGPAEATTFASAQHVRPEDCRLPGGVPLGHPLPHTGLHVWDGTRECATGEIGELLISGAGLALRYLGDPALTDERFVTVRVDGRAVRVYRTGDRAHRDRQGRLFFDGRDDRQIKIRGHRIELGAVETAVAAVPGVTWCRALPVQDDDGSYRDLYLAYTSPATPPVEPGQILAFVEDRLPAYLIPRRLLRIDRPPMSGTGKLDERELIHRMAATAPAPPTPSATAAEPDDVASIVSTVVDTVLGRSVEPDQDFFAAGGTSIEFGVLCTRLAARLNRPVPLSVAIQRATPRRLTEWLDGHQPADDRAASASTKPDDRPLPLSEMQTSFWMRQSLDPTDVSGLCPVVHVVDGALERRPLDQAFHDVVERHPALRAGYTFDDDGTTLVAVPATGVVRDAVTWLAPAETDAEAVRALAGVLMRPLDVEEGPVWRAVAVPSRDGTRTTLGIVVHHIAFDGWSETVLVADLSRAYAARRAGREPDFPPIPTPADARRRLADRLAAVDLDAQRRYWRETLRGVPALPLPAPAGSSDGRRTASESSTRTFRLDPTIGVEVGRLAEKHATTPFAVLLSAYAAALARLTDKRDFGLGVTVSRRAGAGIDDLVGCFVETVCLRPRPAVESGWPDLLDGMLPVIRDGMAAQDLPFSEVVRLVNPARGRHNPLYQVLFVYQDHPRTDGSFAGHPMRRVPLPAVHGVCELVVEVWPEPDGGYTVDMTYQIQALEADFVTGSFDRFAGILTQRDRR
ncbi:AMP-binding protein [Micromonospora maritima]|uniref:AMP-binding protein n=1 Tax=Micromonospora maritima TaxID=986711 RepID=UPI00157C009C|nr:AMP-binding protein [Micromonospora maritima]